MKNRKIMGIIIVLLLFILFFGFRGCKKTTVEKQDVTFRIGYRASLPADIGPLLAYESEAFKDMDIMPETKGFGPPALLLQELRNNNIELVTVMPLEPVLNDIRLGKANYFIYCLLCFSPTEPFDMIVVKKNKRFNTWDSLRGKTLGVIPSDQNILIGQAIVSKTNSAMNVRPYNPQNPLLSLETGDIDAIHVLGTDAARAVTSKDKYVVLEYCPVSKYVFDNKVIPAGVGLISKKWVQENPKLAAGIINKSLEYSKNSRKSPNDIQLIDLLRKQKYGNLDLNVINNLTFPPIIPYNEIKSEHFEPLLSFLETNNIEVASMEIILNHIYKTNQEL